MFVIPQQIHRYIDRIILYNMSQRIPQTLEPSVGDSTSLEEVLAQTVVDQERTAVAQLTLPGEHPIWLKSSTETIATRVRVRPSRIKDAPVVIYHHGLNEFPYNSSFRRIFFNFSLPYHLVCVQAPFHNNWSDPIAKGFATVNRMYQLFAGSMRLIELMRTQFVAAGAPHSVLIGLSWGGISCVLHEAHFQNSRAVIPMISSPNLARVLIDCAQMFDRNVTVSAEVIEELLDFTTYYERCDPDKIYPLLGEEDLFFRYAHHAALFSERPLRTIPRGHITAMWPGLSLRRHVIELLSELSEV